MSRDAFGSNERLAARVADSDCRIALSAIATSLRGAFVRWRVRRLRITTKQWSRNVARRLRDILRACRRRFPLRRINCATAVFVAIGSGACHQHGDCDDMRQHPQLEAVRSTTTTWVDASRSRSLQVRMYRPVATAGARPLVIFSSGHAALEADHEGLGQFLAAHGYICVVVIHPDGSRAAVRRTETNDARWLALEEAERDAAVWIDRIADMRFAIATTLADAAAHADANRIAVGGHSFGAFTASTLVGATFVDPRSGVRVDARDERVRAAFMMAPQGRGWFGLDAKSWSTMASAALFITGDRDISVLPKRRPAWRRESFERAQPGDKWLLRFAEAEHMSFTSRASDDRVAPVQHRVILAFLDAYVRDDAQARSFLHTVSANRSCRDGATLSSK
jgi:predicted dienelactone hydrolase